MFRRLFSAGLALALCSVSLQAQDRPQRGKIKEVTADSVTITVDGKDVQCELSANTKIMSAANEAITPPLDGKGVKPGAAVMFLTRERDGKSVLVGLRLMADDGPGKDPRAQGPASKPGEIRRAKIKKLDLDQKRITLAVDGKDEEFQLVEETQVLGATGKDLQDRFKGIKDGADVFFRATKRDGKSVLVALKTAEGGTRSPMPLMPRVESDKLRPLIVLGKEKYQGYEGGLYPEGKNDRPAAHEAAGLALAKQVQPLDKEGKPSADGTIVLLSVGMSNTAQISQGFQKALAGEQDKNPRLVFVNGAQGGMTAFAIQDPEDNRSGTRYWTTVDDRLKAAGVTRAQVQVVWIKQADAGPSQGFPAYAQKLEEELQRIVQLLPKRFPNVKLAYLSGRTYGGFAKTALNPEPYAYESGFSVKWLIEKQLKGEPVLSFDAANGEVKAPWLSWGPYLWDNGVVKRPDGYRPEEGDFAGDGTHHAGPGVEKMGGLLLQFFKTDSTAKPWFVRP
jgi:Cu/Ag efflux protein CusF